MSSNDGAAECINNGNTALERKDHEAAIKSFTDAFESDPMQAEALIKRSEALLESGKTRDAFHDAQRATVIDPSNINCWLILAKCLVKMENKNGAEFALNQGKLLDSKNSKELIELEQKVKVMKDSGEPLKDENEITIARAGGPGIKSYLGLITQFARQTGLIETPKSQSAQPQGFMDKVLNHPALKDITNSIVNAKNITGLLGNSDIKTAEASIKRIGKIENIAAIASNPLVLGLAKKLASL